MPNLSDALAALETVTKAEGVVAMNAEALTTYAADQVKKMATDADKGVARKAYLEGVIGDALDVYKADPLGEHEFVPFVEPVASAPAVKIEGVSELSAAVKQLTEMLAKQAPAAAVAPVVNHEGLEPETTTIHPPPVPAAGGIATNADEVAKGLANDTAARGGAAIDPEDDKEFGAGEGEIMWPTDLNTEQFRKGVAKNCDDTRPTWGFDGETVPTAIPAG